MLIGAESDWRGMMNTKRRTILCSTVFDCTQFIQGGEDMQI